MPAIPDIGRINKGQVVKGSVANKGMMEKASTNKYVVPKLMNTPARALNALAPWKIVWRLMNRAC